MCGGLALPRSRLPPDLEEVCRLRPGIELGYPRRQPAALTITPHTHM